jgi:ribosomal protein S25
MTLDIRAEYSVEMSCVVEVLEHLEAHDVLVPLHPVVHLAFFDVAHAVVHVLEAAGVLAVVVVDGRSPIVLEDRA